MDKNADFKVRLRVRLGKALRSDDPEIVLNVDGREVKLKSHKPGEPLLGTNWIILTASGFPTPEEAQNYGEKLRNWLELAALSAMVGVDVGEDKTTNWLNEEWARAKGIIKQEDRLVPNVHGLMVIPDDPNLRVPFSEVTMTIHSDPTQLTGAIAELSGSAFGEHQHSLMSVRLLNLAHMCSDALARAALAFSAVEALGQDEEWSDRQKSRLSKTASDIQVEFGPDDQEMLEIAEAINSRLHRIGLRQGVMRLLGRLGLKELKKEWDRLYGIRSGLFHGTMRLSKSETDQFANDSLRLCTKVVLAQVRNDGVKLPAVTEVHYGTF